MLVLARPRVAPCALVRGCFLLQLFTCIRTVRSGRTAFGNAVVLVCTGVGWHAGVWLSVVLFSVVTVAGVVAVSVDVSPSS